MELTVSIGARLREERDRLRLNQTAFSAVGGVTKKTQMLYEAGERAPDARYLAAVHEIGADVRYIVTGLRDAPPPEALSTDERDLLTLFRAAPLAVKAAAIGALQGGSGGMPPRKAQKQVFNADVSGQVAMGKIINKGKKAQ